ncbi:prephenate dehydrogenase/arogenate dehydrogenase family protein [Candidatus Pelagibacter sp.]|nr:prephenate dehydrogenase/arogenate dehydrogenase family protein [Candidatus Pelagibacter sp.]|tara:strand:+ start:1716 stop:2615 length:900 start_codon:yes stop_codon:yes gene_type:complete
MFNSILIIGCGMIGSSILRGAISRKLSNKIYVFEKNIKYHNQIKRINKKIILLKKLDKKIEHIDLVVISTPMSEYKKIILKLNKNLGENSLITDVGSTRGNVAKLIKENLSKNLNWIMSHPISGSEASGPMYGSKDLFKNKWCIIIKSKKNNLLKNKLIKFWKKLGSNVLFMQEKEHDKIFSVTSHLPHLIAYNLIKTAQDFQKLNRTNVIKYSAGGLRDFSRIAASNEIMWRDIFFNNRKNMSHIIDLFMKNLQNFKTDINKKRNSQLLQKLKKSKLARRQILFLKQDVSKPDFGRKN